MRIGVVFPQTELGGDPGAVRAFATAASQLRFAHIAVFDHVVGADPAVHRDWSGPYEVQSTFHEPFVLFGYLAALTSLEPAQEHALQRGAARSGACRFAGLRVTSILILPQRQTVLVAKQAAEIDLLTQGKLRLGVGLGWNEVEYEALGQNFSDRGARLGEQVALLRRLWTETSVMASTSTSTSPALGSRRCRSSVRSRSGSELARTLRRGGPAGSPTAGSRWTSPGPRLRGPPRSCTAPRYRPGATRARWAWRAGSTSDPRAHHRSLSRSRPGARPAPHIRASTPCGPAFRPSMSTSPRWPPPAKLRSADPRWQRLGAGPQRQPDGCSSPRPDPSNGGSQVAESASLETTWTRPRVHRRIGSLQLRAPQHAGPRGLARATASEAAAPAACGPDPCEPVDVRRGSCVKTQNAHASRSPGSACVGRMEGSVAIIAG